MPGAVGSALTRAREAWRAHPRAAGYLLALALHLALAPFFIHDWDGFVFIRTVQDFLHGVSPYKTVEMAPSYIFVGDGAPVVNSWYAYPPVPLLLMTPAFAVLTALFGHAPWLERVAIKLPLVAGDLALAFVAYGFVLAALRGREDAQRRARLVERVILFNPFLIFISAAWGMFDAWMMAFLVGSLWLLLEKRPAWAGVAFACAVLVKPFPAFVAPIVAALAFRWSGGARGLARWATAGAGAALVLCAPFFLDAPSGFLQQVVYNHVGRPPQGFTLAGVPLAFEWINHLLGTSLPTGIGPEAISRWSFFAMVALLGVLWIQGLSVREPEAAAHLILATLVGLLLVSKVVNEQYFVMPVVMAAVAFAVSERPLHLWTRRLYTFGGLVSGVLLGYHFLTFLPVDVAEVLFPFDPLGAAPRLTHGLGLNDDQAFVLPTLLAAAALVPALAVSLRLVGGRIVGPLRALWPLRRERARALPVPLAILAVLVLVVPTSAVLLASTAQSEPLESYHAPSGRLVGAYYYLWWNNPAHDPDVEYGNWREGVSEVPLEGYYTTTSGKMRNDFVAMRENGIELVVYAYHPYDRPKLPALVRVAGEAGVVTAPLVDLEEMLQDPSWRARDANGSALPIEFGFSLRNETRDAIAQRLADPADGFSHFPTWWKLDGRPVVFVKPTQEFFYDLDGDVKDRLVDAAFRLAHGATPRATLNASVPTTPDALRQPGNALWREAYHEVVREFWRGVENETAKRFQPLYIVASQTWDPTHGADRGASLALAHLAAADDAFIYSPSELWANHLDEAYPAQAQRWRDALLLDAQAQRARGATVFATVTPGYDDRVLRKAEGFVVPYEHDGVRTLDLLWDDAVLLDPDVILVDSWNNFRAGNALEPTREHGDALLADLAARAKAWEGAANASGPRALLVTNFLGASYHDGSGDPDGSYAFSLRAARRAEATLPGRVDLADWNGPTLGATNLSPYALVVVEPGAKDPATPDAATLPARLDAYARAGGRVLLLGSDVGTTYAKLATWSEPPFPSAHAWLETDAGRIPVPVDPWTTRHDVPSDARVLLWMTDGAQRYPGVWEVPRGEGTVAVTAFRPQGTFEDAAPGLFEAVLAAATHGGLP